MSPSRPDQRKRTSSVHVARNASSEIIEPISEKGREVSLLLSNFFHFADCLFIRLPSEIALDQLLEVLEFSNLLGLPLPRQHSAPPLESRGLSTPLMLRLDLSERKASSILLISCWKSLDLPRRCTTNFAQPVSKREGKWELVSFNFLLNFLFLTSFLLLLRDVSFHEHSFPILVSFLA